MRQVENFIRGEFVAARDGKRFDKVSPVTGEVIASIAEAGRSDVNEAVLAAKAALQGEWSTFTTNQRVEMLYEVADEITRRFEDFVEAEMADTGQPSNVMRHVFIPRGAANFKIFADTIKNVPTESFMLDTPDGAGALNYGVRTPKGVIGVISPWNAPFMLMTWKVGPALACGNTVVVKPSEETPLTSVLLGEVMNKVGVPKGVYNVVNGFGPDSAGAFLTEHKDVDAITFTGETRTGTAIMKAAAEGTRDVSFEMGGKNAGIVFADCDFDKAIEGISRSSFLNSGQVCLGTERVYVERPIFDKFVAALKEKAEAVNYGKPTDEGVNYGPLISKEHQDKVLSYYKKAVEEGATVITGGGVPEVPEALKNGHWIQPTIWTDLADDAAVVKEEIFGPCCHIRPFDSEEEVIGLANSTDYGLATTIWTKDLPRAHRMAAKIDVGICWVNSWFLRDLRTAFGGTKQSGIGREGGVHSLEFYTELRNVCVKL
ncbi:2-hydroxymuconic semialdehyde dehydrogenase [Alteromonas oceani]|jgi:aminomuconate-semialdehyde/2-hydroxymuconate-6-semialdehyde dehydrogenase|uniref:2-hydroxymuconic semialdehyde dehydrogenase n=1 Tax=Alteromonas oceani TaxID=2071609 RepID=A0ABV7K611_9ALTE|nr:2-hydroxymuconic semialdehyde dehydrogenase [Alteromonas oceani]MCP4864363.1 2-hydroxymuconic semialdehyde dehydrogenase [Alteromonas sp.]MEC7692342.1 2-hydroxymuconic semialdehyde dehydrogenase [Pseudomonadota bacterium]|tara:strand:+ start:191 stop:1651 length:1461 start_codon:yes stop_codon:yes gene_type:complete